MIVDLVTNTLFANSSFADSSIHQRVFEMDDSLVVRLHVRRDAASATTSQLVASRLESGHDAGATQSPDHTSHEDDDDSDGQRKVEENAKKRKSTYAARRAEMAELKEKVVALREELGKLKANQLRFQPLTVEEKNETASLRWQVAQSRLAIAGAQSLVSSYSAQYGKPLLGSYIHLPYESAERQQILESLKPQKMQEALAFLAARCQFLDMRRHTRQVESFETVNGDRITNHWEVTRIKEGQPSVRRVYDEMLEFVRTSEMAIAEKAGIVGVRESDTWLETVDATQFRFLTSYPPEFLVEKNYVVYTQFFPRSEALDQPHGVILCDYVDQDDVNPYQPEERIRMDTSSVTMVVESPVVDADEPRSAVVVYWSFKRIHKSPQATDEELWAIDRLGPRSYYDVMMRTVREKLAWQT